MPRPPSKHGLEKKYKPWRKGKSKTSKVSSMDTDETKSSSAKTAKPKGSLRHVLRGKQRLLAKLVNSNNEEDEESLKRRRMELETSIEELQNEIAQKEQQEKERQNAIKSHGVRFLERQRLTRMEKSTRKLLSQSNTSTKSTTKSNETYKVELLRIALDQVYVAHFPHEEAKYIPLFRASVRLVDTEKVAQKRAKIRHVILQKLGKCQIQHVDWISKDQYKRLPLEWNYHMEQSMFSVQKKSKTKDNKNMDTKNDNRFALSSEHSAVLEVAEQLEAKAEKEISEKQQQEKEKENNDGACVSVGDSSDDSDSDSDDSSASSDSDADEADPLVKNKMVSTKMNSDDNDSSTSSSSSGDSSSSSDDSSDDDDDDDDDDKGQVHSNINKINNTHNDNGKGNGDDDDFDDFLVPVDETNQESSSTKNAFENAKHQVQPWDPTKGDKSKGWATQRQRPDQRKRRRTQR